MSYIESRTITFNYVVYEPGDMVVASNRASSLTPGKVYTVTAYMRPVVGSEIGTVYLKGRFNGVFTTHVAQVDSDVVKVIRG